MAEEKIIKKTPTKKSGVATKKKVTSTKINVAQKTSSSVKKKPLDSKTETRKTSINTIKTPTKKSGVTTKKKVTSTKTNVTQKTSSSVEKKPLDSKTETKKVLTRKIETERNKKESSNENIIPVKEVPIVEKTNAIFLDELNFSKEITPEKQLKKVVKKISSKNYIIAFLILLVVLLLSFWGYKMFQSYEEKLWNEGYFYHTKENVKMISYDDLKSKMESLNDKNAFILFNYRGKEETYQLEKEVLKLVKDNQLEDAFYYVDLTNYLNKDIQKELNMTLNTDKINNIPNVIYLKDHTVFDVAQREDKQILESADFAKILDIYEFKK